MEKIFKMFKRRHASVVLCSALLNSYLLSGKKIISIFLFQSSVLKKIPPHAYKKQNQTTGDNKRNKTNT